MSLTEIEYVEKTQSVQIIMNVFMDDFEMALNKMYDIDLQLASKQEVKDVETYFERYIKKHFHINFNDSNHEYTYLGKEYDGNIIYFYLEIKNVASVSNITIQNNILMEDFPEQQNLIKVKIKKRRQSLFLTKKNDKGLLKF